MIKIPRLFILIAIGIMLFVPAFFGTDSKDWKLFGGMFSLYIGAITLYYAIKSKPSMTGLRFRGIAAGAGGIILGLFLLIKFFI